MRLIVPIHLWHFECRAEVRAIIQMALMTSFNMHSSSTSHTCILAHQPLIRAYVIGITRRLMHPTAGWMDPKLCRAGEKA